jgi:transposase
MTDTPTTSKPLDWREGRRRRAWELHQQGWTQERIAQALGCSQSSVSGWLKRASTEGLAALRTHPPPGPTPLLSPSQRLQIPVLLKQGAEAHGWRGDFWTTKRVAHLIGEYFAVYYHPAHVSRLLRQLGWSVQKPITRAAQRDAAAIRTWTEERLPALKKKRPAKGAPSSG